MFNEEYIAKRVINDLLPIYNRSGKEKPMHEFCNPQLFVGLCALFFRKKINNKQFKEYLEKLCDDKE